MPLDDIARVCTGGLILMTLCMYLTIEYRIVERLMANRIIKRLCVAGNIALSLLSLFMLMKNFYLGIIAVFFTVLSWIIQYSERHSAWLRPIALNVLLVLVALSLLWWFDELPAWKKLWIMLQYCEPALLGKIKHFLPF